MIFKKEHFLKRILFKKEYFFKKRIKLISIFETPVAQ